MQKSPDKKLIHRILSALTCGGLALSAAAASAAPVVVTEPVTEDMVTTTEGIAANITGGVGNIVVGTPNAADETKPVIGDPSSSSYYKYCRVAGSWLGSDEVKTLVLKGGTAIIYSGTMGDVTGASIYLKNGGMATVTGASVVFNGGNTQQSEYGGLFGALASVNAEASAPYARAYTSGNTLTINDGDIDGPSAGATSYANSNTGQSEVIASANKNTVTVNGGEVMRTVRCGYGYAFSTAGTEHVTAETNENNVLINHSEITGNVEGGYATATTENGAAIARAKDLTLTLNMRDFIRHTLPYMMPPKS
ncbi:hypothetical protein [Selenomonas infelix]|nr:hypothetical protein [Selenomonas infelix]